MSIAAGYGDKDAIIKELREQLRASNEALVAAEAMIESLKGPDYWDKVREPCNLTALRQHDKALLEKAAAWFEEREFVSVIGHYEITGYAEDELRRMAAELT